MDDVEVVHCGIESLHVMQNSYGILCELALPVVADVEKVDCSSPLFDGDETWTSGYHTKLDESGWLRQLAVLLGAAIRVAEKLHTERASVMVCCANGW